MPTPIDWLYASRSCNTCKKAAAHCDAAGVVTRETVDATKVKLGPEAALKLVAGVSKVIAARGQAVRAFDLKKDKPDAETLLAHLIGPTGNLRAPTARVGKTLLVGFNPEMYDEVLTAPR